MSCRAHRCMSLRVALSFLLKRQKKLSQEAHDLWKRAMGFSFFFHGLGSNLITTVGSERPENITFQGKRQKKSAMGRSVPKRWAQVDFTACRGRMIVALQPRAISGFMSKGHSRAPAIRGSLPGRGRVCDMCVICICHTV